MWEFPLLHVGCLLCPDGLSGARQVPRAAHQCPLPLFPHSQERVKFHVLLTSYEMVLSERTLNKVSCRGEGVAFRVRGVHDQRGPCWANVPLPRQFAPCCLD